MAEKTLDIIGVGNAVIDLIATVDDSFLSEFGFMKSANTVLNDDTLIKLESKLTSYVQSEPGGCAANTLSCMSRLGAQCHFIGKMADDDCGQTFLKSLNDSGISYNTEYCKTVGTGRIHILVTSDTDRTFAAYYGACNNLTPQDIDEDKIRRARAIYLDGFVLFAPHGAETLIHAARLAKKHDCKVIFNPNDISVPQGFRKTVMDILVLADILICNEQEAFAISEKSNVSTAMKFIRQYVKTGAVTLGERGSVVFAPGETLSVDPIPPRGPVVNTNGAGDHFAAGFVFGLLNDYSLHKSGYLGTYYASEVLLTHGPRLPAKQAA